jgi:hypothetical protein
MFIPKNKNKTQKKEINRKKERKKKEDQDIW